MISGEARLAVTFLAVRGAVQQMEEAIEQGEFTEEEVKLLDKATVLIKAGAKLQKQVLRRRGGYRRIGAIAKGLKP